jgi:hypothetical protein
MPIIKKDFKIKKKEIGKFKFLELEVIVNVPPAYKPVELIQASKEFFDQIVNALRYSIDEYDGVLIRGKMPASMLNTLIERLKEIGAKVIGIEQPNLGPYYVITYSTLESLPKGTMIFDPTLEKLTIIQKIEHPESNEERIIRKFIDPTNKVFIRWSKEYILVPLKNNNEIKKEKMLTVMITSHVPIGGSELRYILNHLPVPKTIDKVQIASTTLPPWAQTIIAFELARRGFKVVLQYSVEHKGFIVVHSEDPDIPIGRLFRTARTIILPNGVQIPENELL